MTFWLQNPRVLERLLDEPYRFEFFQAVRLVEHWFTEHGGARPAHAVPHHIGFRTTLTTTFPPSEIEQASSFDEAGEHLADKATRVGAMVAGEISRMELTPAFFGLLGSQGALPLRYTEQILTGEQSRRDRGTQAFFDIFSNRATALFYAAWKKYRLPLHYELDRNERFLPILQALAGVADHSSAEALHEEPGALVDDAVAGHSAAARHRAVSVVYLQRTLSDYFGLPIRVEQFIGQKYEVPPEEQSCLPASRAAPNQAGARMKNPALGCVPISRCNPTVRTRRSEKSCSLARQLFDRTRSEYERSWLKTGTKKAAVKCGSLWRGGEIRATGQTGSENPEIASRSTTA